MIEYQIQADRNHFVMGRIRSLEAISRFKSIFYQTIFLITLFTIAILGYVTHVKGHIVLPIIFLITYIIVMFAKPICTFFYMRSIKKTPFYKKDLKFIFSEKGLLAISENQEESIEWSGITKSIRCSDGFLLYQGKDFFNWFPDNCLVRANLLGSMKKLMEKNV